MAEGTTVTVNFNLVLFLLKTPNHFILPVIAQIFRTGVCEQQSETVINVYLLRSWAALLHLWEMYVSTISSVSHFNPFVSCHREISCLTDRKVDHSRRYRTALFAVGSCLFLFTVVSPAEQNILCFDRVPSSGEKTKLHVSSVIPF